MCVVDVLVLRQAFSSVCDSYATEEEEDEVFLESLPTDMMEDGDLQQMTIMARQASFLTRDLSSW